MRPGEIHSLLAALAVANVLVLTACGGGGTSVAPGGGSTPSAGLSPSAAATSAPVGPAADALLLDRPLARHLGHRGEPLEKLKPGQFPKGPDAHT